MVVSDCPLECTRAFGGHPTREEHNGLFISTPTDRIWFPFVKKKKKSKSFVSVCVCFRNALTPPCRTPWSTAALGDAARIRHCLCPCCRILSCLPVYTDFYLVERGGCSQRTALGIVLCSAGSQLLFEILLKTEQTSLNWHFLLASALQSLLHVPLSFWSLLVLTYLYIAMSSSRKKTVILSDMSPGSPVKCSTWCKQGQLCWIQWNAVYLNHRKSYPFSLVLCILFHCCMFYLPGILKVFSYTLLLTSSTEFHSHFVPDSFQL